MAHQAVQEPQVAGRADITGKDHLVGNILTCWAAQVVTMIGGFVLPRMTDHYVGQTALGVWDFSWSLVAYFGLVQVGIVSSVNRYVAAARVAGNGADLNRAVSSVMCVLVVMALVVLALAVGTAEALPTMFGGKLGNYTADAQWLVLLFGASLAVQVTFSAYGGVLTGCYRQGIYNGICAAGQVVLVGGLVSVLVVGGGLIEMAVVNLAVEGVRSLMMAVAAHRVCPELRIGVRQARWSTARGMMAFGAKYFAFTFSALLQGQTAVILIAGFLGPAVVAIYSRPMGLIHSVVSLMQRSADVLTPTASAMQALGQKQELRQLLTKSTRYGAFVAVPIVMVLAVLGNDIMHIWMGPRYERGAVLVILAVGYLGSLVHRPSFNILTGLNAHGRAAAITLVSAIASAGLMTLALGLLHTNLEGVALGLVLPLALTGGICVPLHACRRLNMSFGKHMVDAMKGPVLCSLPYGMCLAAVRILLGDQPYLALGAAAVATVVVLGPLYWRYALPPSLRGEVIRIFVRFLRIPHIGNHA